MFRNSVYLVVFFAGLLAVGWIGAGYVGSNALGLAVVLVIGACYLAGAFELYRYRQASAALGAAVAAVPAGGLDLEAWLDRLPAGLRNPVRLRVEGERVALPAPVLTPYLVGLLVLLGMLGTLLGMMATLRGTGLALESATDLDAIRGSLAAPVQGLGFAFGTSIAGVASSAMLGLLSALCRRERLQGVQRLDASIATTLRTHSQGYRRREAFRLQQQQSDLLPVLVDRLQAMVLGLEQQSAAANERLLASHEAFHARTEMAYTRLAGSVEQSLQAGVAESARVVGATLQPVLEATMAGLAREAGSLNAGVAQAVQRQLDGLTAGFEASAANAAASWEAVLAEQRRSLDALAAGFEASAAHAAEHWNAAAAEQRRSLDGLATGFEASAAHAAGRWEAVVAEQQRSLEGLSAGFERSAATAAAGWDAVLAGQTAANQALSGDLRTTLAGFADTFEQRAHGLVDAVSARLDAGAGSAAQALDAALVRQQAANEQLADGNRQALAAAAATFEAHAASLVATVGRSHTELQAALEARDQARLAAWTERFGSMSAALSRDWAQTGEAVAARQQDICDTLAHTAQAITEQSRTHASDTLAEISRLVQVASEAPRAAAEVVTELRQKLSDSMLRDTAMLEERSRLLATLETLLDAVNHASTEQRGAVDALVSTSADLLERVGARFSGQLEAETGKLAGAAAQLTGSAVEVASLGDAFGSAVQLFGQSNEALMQRLEHVGGALDASLARSDEQLAYYVAQAREVIDLSVLSQKQIIEELQQLAGRRGGAEAA